MVRGKADHVDRLIAFFVLQAFDVATVGGDHFVLAGARRNRLAGLPLLEAHADLAQLMGDGGMLVMHGQRCL